jgi:outer membrane protein TolC
LAADGRVQAAREKVEAANCNHAAAARRYRPSIRNRTGYALLTDSPSFVFLGNAFPIVDNDFVGSATTARMPLYTGGQIDNGRNAASCQSNAARWDLRRTILDVKLEVVEAYVAILRAKRAVEVAESNVSSLDAHQKVVAAMLERGAVPRNDLLAAQVSVADAQQQEIRARNALAAARATYNRLLWRPLDRPVQLAEVEVPPASGEVAPLTDEAIATRPELAALTAQMNALRFQAESTLGALRPQLGAEGGFLFFESPSIEPDGMGTLMLSFEWTPYDGGVSRAKANALQHRANSVARSRDDTASQIALQVQNTWLDEQETRKRVLVTEKAIEQAEENLRVAKVRFSQGAAINTEVLDAEVLRTRTYSNYYDAVYDAVLATYRLRRAIGNL